MSYPGTLNTIRAADSPSIDAFGRWKVSNPIQLRGETFEDDLQPLHYEAVVVGTGTVTHVPNESNARLRVLANGDSALFQGRQYIPYRTGFGQAADVTFHTPATEAGINWHCGYGDANNGVFLEAVGTTVNMLQRSNASGVLVSRQIPQASWNLDTFGAGALNPSGWTIDLTQDHIGLIWWMDLQWLAEGRVRTGFSFNGIAYPAHQFVWAGLPGSTLPYMRTARLPVRWYLENVSAGAGTWDLKAQCSSVYRDGSDSEPSTTFATDTGTTVYNAPASLNSLCAIRPGVANPRISLYPESVSITVTGANPVYWQVVRNPTLGGALTFGAATSGSLAQVSTTHTSVSGGTIVASGHVGAGAVGGRGTSASQKLSETLPACCNVAGDTPDVYVLAVYGIGGASNCYGTLNYREVR